MIAHPGRCRAQLLKSPSMSSVTQGSNGAKAWVIDALVAIGLSESLRALIANSMHKRAEDGGRSSPRKNQRQSQAAQKLTAAYKLQVG